MVGMKKKYALYDADKFISYASDMIEVRKSFKIYKTINKELTPILFRRDSHTGRRFIVKDFKL